MNGPKPPPPCRAESSRTGVRCSRLSVYNCGVWRGTPVYVAKRADLCAQHARAKEVRLVDGKTWAIDHDDTRSS